MYGYCKEKIDACHYWGLTLSLPESVNGDIKVFLTFKSVDENAMV